MSIERVTLTFGMTDIVRRDCKLKRVTIGRVNYFGCVTYFGRVAVRATGSFNITTKTETVQGISHKHCTLISRNDGYQLTQLGGAFLPQLPQAVSWGILANCDEYRKKAV